MIVTDSTEGKSVSGLKVQRLEELGDIEIVLVSGSKSSDYAMWKEMIEEHHYLHSSKLFGQQIKYLVRSLMHGNIGALAFSSAAWRLQLRDERIGWDDERRERELSKVVCNSRFLILPEYGVKNLASNVMSKCLKRLAVDWEEAYQVRPVLAESFVDKERFSGSCYKASNWVLLGETKGRGRNDKYHENSLSRKYIFVYELEKGILGPAPLQEEEDWVSKEFRYAELPNKAKKKRLITLTRDFFAKPVSPIPLCCEGQAKQKGAYRFFSDDKVKPEDILNSHIKQTIERTKEHKVVLSINDTTSFNLSNHKSARGLGCLSSSQGELGYLLHDTVVFTTSGIPLGVLDAQSWSREVKEHGKSEQRRSKTIEEKESFKWLKSLQATARAQEEAPDVKYVSVGDRESDIYELFELAEELNCSFVVRSCQNRRTTEGVKTWDLVESEKASGRIRVNVCRKNKKEREAELEIRFREVTLRVPRDKKNKKEKRTVTLFAISARETSPPEGEAALHWRLFTNINIEDFEEACEKVEWYSIRFSIETFHRILKSGRKSEDRRLETLERLERCLSIDMITAWRLMYLTMLGRKTPEISSDLFFNENEIEVLKRIKYGSSYNPDQSLSIKGAVGTIAILGGFVTGKNRVPGVEVMWRGIRRLEDIVIGLLLMKGELSEKSLRDFSFEFG